MTRTPLWGRIGVVLLAIAGTVITAKVLQRDYALVDLHVYEWAAHAAFDDSQLYDTPQPGTGLLFTYTPFAALVFAALRAVGLLHDVAFIALSLVCLLRASWLLAANRGALFASWSTRWVALGIASATMVAEPGNGTILLGQVNFLLLWLVLEGLLGPWRTRAGGVAVGLATAIKLTPGIYLALFAVTGRWRQLVAGIATIAATIALSWLVLCDETEAFWTGTGVDAARTGNVEFVANQSINGVLWRLLGEGGSTAAWLVLSALAAAACLLLARRFDRTGDLLVPIGLAGIAGLLVSPVSWTHHWVVALPLVVGLLGVSAAPLATRVLTIAACAVFASRMVWHVPNWDHREFDHTPLQELVGCSYVLAALALLVAAWLARPRET